MSATGKAWPSLLCFTTCMLASVASLKPGSVAFGDLTHGHSFSEKARKTIENALTNVGIVTVSDIPGYDVLRRHVLREAHRCAQVSPEAMRYTFDDGTMRTSLGGVSDASGAHEIPVGEGVEIVAACKDFHASSSKFRDLIARISESFGARLGELIAPMQGSLPLLHAAKGGRDYETVSDIFRHGQHLEHFHSYHLPERKVGAESTIEFHTDQGLCIAFTSALLVQQSGDGDVQVTDKPTGEFHIQLSSGARVLVEFPHDHLMFMLGDGVNQYVNTRLQSGPALRAVPHAMVMPGHARSESRVWYGRMFLPPSDAVSVDHEMTYGRIRNTMITAWASEDEDSSAWKLSLGCSGGQQARELSATQSGCAANQMYCWFRCMNYTVEATPDTCTAQGTELKCTNARDEVSNGNHHGAYAPRCTNSTQPVRGSCELTLINSGLPSSCSATGFEAWVEANAAGFTGRWDLSADAAGDAQVVFKWRVSAGKVEGFLAFNGKASYISLGIENVGAKKNGMMGAPVIFGISNDDTEHPDNVGVFEYTISDTQSRFSRWNTKHASPSLTNSEMLSENCYAAMRFTTDKISGVPLNISSGSNRLIWALRASSYMQVGKDSYHEGCYNGERVRFRGHLSGIDFQDVTHRAVSASTSTTVGTTVSTTSSNAVQPQETGTSTRVDSGSLAILLFSMASLI